MRVEEVLNQSPPYVDIDLYASDRPLADAIAANGGGRDAAALSAFGNHWGSAEMFERATREWRISPQIATISRSTRPLLRRMVSASSSAWVGCSCEPSPALITEQSTFLAKSSTAPEA